MVAEPVIQRKRKRGDAFKGRKFQWWFFTWNNPEHPINKELLLELGKKVGYIKFQYERGKNDGTLHYQGVCWFKQNISHTTFKSKTCNSIHATPVKFIDKACDYCGKDDTRVEGPWEAGTKPRQGQRTDLLKCKSIIDDGGGLKDLFQKEFTNTVKHHRGLILYMQVVNKDRFRKWQTKSYIYYGAAGTGKSEAAKIETEEWGGGTFWLSLESGTGGKIWWDGYDGEENVVIDEFHCQMKLTDIKKLIDSTPYQVPIKCGFVQMLAKRVWILSNVMIDCWYYKALSAGPHERDAFNRRIHYKEYFGSKFLGQPDFDSFSDSRIYFVQIQKEGLWVI